MAYYRLSLLSHVFDTNHTLYPLQPSNQISAIERSFAELQKDLQHQAILFLIALYVQRFYLYSVKGQITGNIGDGTGAIGSNDADKLAVTAAEEDSTPSALLRRLDVLKVRRRHPRLASDAL